MVMVNHKTGDILYTANTNIDLLTFAIVNVRFWRKADLGRRPLLKLAPLGFSYF